MNAVVFAYHKYGDCRVGGVEETWVRHQCPLSHRDDPEETIWFASVADWAAKHGMPCHTPPLCQRA